MIFLYLKKLKFNLNIITGTTLTSPINVSSTSIENVIWSPDYPHSYDGNYDQVKQNITLSKYVIAYDNLL